MANKVTPRTLSGFMELLPQDQMKFDRIVNTLEDVYASYGFLPLDTPNPSIGGASGQGRGRDGKADLQI